MAELSEQSERSELSEPPPVPGNLEPGLGQRRGEQSESSLKVIDLRGCGICPNKANPFHQCVEYCHERFGVVDFTPCLPPPRVQLVPVKPRWRRRVYLPAPWTDDGLQLVGSTADQQLAADEEREQREEEEEEERENEQEQEEEEEEKDAHPSGSPLPSLAPAGFGSIVQRLVHAVNGKATPKGGRGAKAKRSHTSRKAIVRLKQKSAAQAEEEQLVEDARDAVHKVHSSLCIDGRPETLAVALFLSESIPVEAVGAIVGPKPETSWHSEWVRMNMEQAVLDGDEEFASEQRFMLHGEESIAAKINDNKDSIRWKVGSRVRGGLREGLGHGLRMVQRMGHEGKVRALETERVEGCEPMDPR